MEGAAANFPAHFGTETVPSGGGRCSEELIEGPFNNYLLLFIWFWFCCRGVSGGLLVILAADMSKYGHVLTALVGGEGVREHAFWAHAGGKVVCEVGLIKGMGAQK